MKPSIGTFEITIKVFLECDVDEDEARCIASDLDYSINHKLIAETEVVSDDITERFDLAVIEHDRLFPGG